jgi:hypothetical protein
MKLEFLGTRGYIDVRVVFIILHLAFIGGPYARTTPIVVKMGCVRVAEVR